MSSHTIAQSYMSKEDDPTIRRQPSFQWAQFDKPQKSPIKPEPVESPHASPHRLEHDPSTKVQPGPPAHPPPAADKPRPPQLNLDNPTITDPPPKPTRQESSSDMKGFKVTLEDPTWKVLPAALKKYRINNDTWQNYAMFICYGSVGKSLSCQRDTSLTGLDR